jgi:sigma-B regulation protein RsbU (phosphoserine phosphatase)
MKILPVEGLAMFRNLSITWRLSVSVLLASVLTLSAVIGYGYVVARQILEQEQEAKAVQLARATTARIELIEVAVRKIVGGMDGRMELQAPSRTENVYSLLERLVRDNEEIYGASVALEPGAFGYSEAYTSPHVFRSWNQLVLDDRGKKETPYFIQDWYSIPQMMKEPGWSEPYRAESRGNKLMVTYSSPIRDSAGVFRGVVASDISLEWLSDLLDSLPLGKGGYAFLLSKNGTFITHPNRDLILKENIFSQAEEQKNPQLRALGREMVQGKSGFVSAEKLFAGQEGWLMYRPIQSTGWSIGIFFPEAEVMAKVAELSRKEGAIGFVGFLFLLPVILLISRSITGPLRKLAESTQALSAGDLDAPLPQIPGQDEVANLANSFAAMRDELKKHISMLQDAATAKERIESELRIAQRIQMELVPKTFPPFPERTDFELHAMMTPAREVGGDFYDFMMPDAEHLWVVIGDVSGKGIAAALFMAVTRTFLRAFVQEEKSPGKVLARVNNELARNNEANMFVTLFCGVVHLPTGKFRWANGANNLPFLTEAAGEPEFLPRTKGALVGAMEDIRFDEAELTLHAGDMLYLYTDGVNEAMDEKDQLFGNARTREVLLKYRLCDCISLVSGMTDELSKFTRNAEQSDDITMLALRYFGPNRGN